MSIGDVQKISVEEWDRMVKDGEVKNSLPLERYGFLMIGQFMAATVEWKGKRYHATGWNIDEPYVELKEIE